MTPCENPRNRFASRLPVLPARLASARAAAKSYRGRILVGRADFPAASATGLLLLVLAAGCAEVPREVRVGEIAIAEETFASLQEPERQTLLDLLGLAAAVSAGGIDELIRPLIERAAEETSVARMPLHLGANDLELDEAGLRDAYDRSPEWELVVRHVVRLAGPGAPDALRQRAREVAGEVARRARAGEDFANLAALYSEEPGAAARGGSLQPGRRGSWVAPFWAAAVALMPGEVSEVVETEYGFHVLRLDDRRPVPFEEADLGGFLERLVPPEVAAEAMERWVEENGAILLDPPAIADARRHLLAGTPTPASLRLARGIRGGEYTGMDLETGWARLGPEQRLSLERGDERGFAAWLEDDARPVIWAGAAREMGAEPPAEASRAARAHWEARTASWARSFGFSEGMSSDQLASSAVPALLSGQSEARSARQELRSFRPLLRRLYPPVLPTP